MTLNSEKYIDALINSDQKLKKAMLEYIKEIHFTSSNRVSGLKISFEYIDNKKKVENSIDFDNTDYEKIEEIYCRHIEENDNERKI
jgi:hypothetical protein